MNILLIEDDVAVGSSFQYALNRKGNNVDWAKNLNDGEKFLSFKKYDVVLLDIMLPDGNGLDFCNKIRAFVQAPIIFVTACDDEGDIINGLEIGGDDYITKPIRINELIARINAVVRRGNMTIKKSDENQIRTGNIKIFYKEYKAYIENEEIQLTPMEFKLIMHLISNHKQVVTKEQLLEKIWDVKGSFIDANSLNVYVKRLREKIEEDAKNPRYIKTVRGIGYRWGEDVYEA